MLKRYMRKNLLKALFFKDEKKTEKFLTLLDGEKLTQKILKLRWQHKFKREEKEIYFAKNPMAQKVKKKPKKIVREKYYNPNFPYDFKFVFERVNRKSTKVVYAKINKMIENEELIRDLDFIINSKKYHFNQEALIKVIFQFK